jgi:hypothetical protein
VRVVQEADQTVLIAPPYNAASEHEACLFAYMPTLLQLRYEDVLLQQMLKQG